MSWHNWGPNFRRRGFNLVESNALLGNPVKLGSPAKASSIGAAGQICGDGLVIRFETGPRRRPASFPRFQTTPASCLIPFGNDFYQLVGRQSSPVLVRYLDVLVTLSGPLIACGSQETTVHRCHKDATGRCKGICRYISTPQIVFGWYQCVDQALRCASV